MVFPRARLLIAACSLMVLVWATHGEGMLQTRVWLLVECRFPKSRRAAAARSFYPTVTWEVPKDLNFQDSQ